MIIAASVRHYRLWIWEGWSWLASVWYRLITQCNRQSLGAGRISRSYSTQARYEPAAQALAIFVARLICFYACGAPTKGTSHGREHPFAQMTTNTIYKPARSLLARRTLTYIRAIFDSASVLPPSAARTYRIKGGGIILWATFAVFNQTSQAHLCN